MHLSFSQRLRWMLHLYKALYRNYHTALIEKLRPFVPKDGAIVDIGAHSGQFSKQFSQFVPNGKVYAFEPGEYALSLLQRVVRHNKFSNIRVTPAGISNQKETRTLYLPVKKSGALGYGLSSLNPRRDAERQNFIEQKITLTTLDDFVSEQNITRIDAIKIDIEGWEFPALQGAKTTIAKYKPVLLLEVDADHQLRAGHQPQEIFDFILPQGYVAFKVDYEKGYTVEPVLQFTGTSDYIFVPEGKTALMAA